MYIKGKETIYICKYFYLKKFHTKDDKTRYKTHGNLQVHLAAFSKFLDQKTDHRKRVGQKKLEALLKADTTRSKFKYNHILGINDTV